LRVVRNDRVAARWRVLEFGVMAGRLFSAVSQLNMFAKVHGCLGRRFIGAHPCAITAYMRSQHVPLMLWKRWFRPDSNLRRFGGLPARIIRKSRSAFVRGPRSHSSMTFQLTE